MVIRKFIKPLRTELYTMQFKIEKKSARIENITQKLIVNLTKII